ncbi:MAG: hypothetical protein JOZ82_04625 [Marmoricola sp.]|nr:hypothetical protein [Marmoricola sp.]
MHVVVIDDQPRMVELVTDFLEEKGMRARLPGRRCAADLTPCRMDWAHLVLEIDQTRGSVLSPPRRSC